MQNIFSDLKVVELAAVLAGPSVGMFFAELGAEVIKVENIHTQGDVTRSWKLSTESQEEEISAYFSSINWGKKSIALDLKQEAGKEVVYDLIKEADMCISSYLPGKDKKLGMDAATLMRINPGLICGEINGYGSEVERAAYDAIIQAEAGYTYMNGLGENTFKMPVALMDVLAGHQLKEAMLLAYIQKLKTGQGSRVESSLLKAGISALVNQASNWLNASHIPQAMGSEHPNIVPYGTQYACSDGSRILLAIGSDEQFKRLCENCLGCAVPAEFTTNTQRVSRRPGVHKFLSKEIATQNPITLLEKISTEKIPAAKVASMPEVLNSSQAQSLLLEARHSKGLRGFSPDSDIFPKEKLNAPPLLSGDAHKILQSLSYDQEKIDKLKEMKAVWIRV
ncbi:MAG: CaiB/BaiF CoA-transferase family protein [Bacteroidota bacterium]